MEASASKRSTAKSGSAKDTEPEFELPEYEAALDQGYLGVATDQWPNEAYTVAGVTARAEDNKPDVVTEGDPDHGGNELSPK
jgi:hypothetical protein